MGSLISHEDDSFDLQPVIWLISGALAFSILSLGLLEMTVDRERNSASSRLRPVFRIFGALTALMLGMLGGSVEPFCFWGYVS